MVRNRRVVVTGMGSLCALGENVTEFWENCLLGKSVVRLIPKEWMQRAEVNSNVWSPLPTLQFERWGLGRIEKLTMDPVSLLALCVTQEAISSAGLCTHQCNDRHMRYELRDVCSSRVGVFFGTGVGGIHSLLENHTYPIFCEQQSALRNIIQNDNQGACVDRIRQFVESLHHLQKLNPFVVSMLMPNAASANIGIKYAITGPNLTYTAACASSTVAIGHAYRSVRDGLIDVAISGGSEYLRDYHGAVFKGFDVARALLASTGDPHKANCPFDRNHSGFLFSEGGAGALVLEERTRAIQRGARIHAEIVGFAETFDAHSIMDMDSSGTQIECMILSAVRDAGLSVSDVDYINAHGTSTKTNDVVEAKVLGRIFGDTVIVNSTKSLLGHTLGASGVLEAIVTILSIENVTTHICRNLEIPIADLNFVTSVEKRDISVGLSQSFAFGGHNAALVIARHYGDE